MSSDKPETRTLVRTKTTALGSVVDTLSEAVAKYEVEKRWGKITLTFQDGKAVMLEQTVTEKLSG